MDQSTQSGTRSTQLDSYGDPIRIGNVTCYHDIVVLENGDLCFDVSWDTKERTYNKVSRHDKITKEVLEELVKELYVADINRVFHDKIKQYLYGKDGGMDVNYHEIKHEVMEMNKQTASVGNETKKASARKAASKKSAAKKSAAQKKPDGLAAVGTKKNHGKDDKMSKVTVAGKSKGKPTVQFPESYSSEVDSELSDEANKAQGRKANQRDTQVLSNVSKARKMDKKVDDKGKKGAKQGDDQEKKSVRSKVRTTLQSGAKKIIDKFSKKDGKVVDDKNKKETKKKDDGKSKKETKKLDGKNKKADVSKKGVKSKKETNKNAEKKRDKSVKTTKKN